MREKRVGGGRQIRHRTRKLVAKQVAVDEA
jgi:hypothetical protein